MDTRDIIVYNPTTRTLELNLSILLTVTSFRLMYEYRKDHPFNGMEDDDEIDQQVEFKMLWWMFHPASPAFREGLTGDELLTSAINEFAPNNWKRGTLFKHCVEDYEDIMRSYNPTYTLLSSHLKALSVTVNSVDKMVNVLSQFVKDIKVDINDSESMSALSKAQEIVSELIDDGDKLDKRIKSLRRIEASFAEEEERIIELRGDKEYLPSLDPENDIERM